MFVNMFHQTLSFLAQDASFWGCAIVGTTLFLFGLLSLFLGLSFELPLVEGDTGLSLFSDFFALKWISFQGIFGFLMLFGWVRLTCKKEFSLSNGASLSWGLGSGFVALLLSSFIFKISQKLHSPGTLFTLCGCVGKQGTVIQEIKKNDFGKISINFEGLTYEVHATSAEKIPSFTPIDVIGYVQEEHLIVTPHTKDLSDGNEIL